MKFVLIFGDAAVGKMTVGQELTKITDLRLFHNHMTIDPVRDIFGDPRRWDILEIRLQRSITGNRLNHKPSWRDREKSENYLKNHGFRCISNDGEIPYANYIKIDNSNLAPDIVAKMIKEKFSL